MEEKSNLVKKVGWAYKPIPGLGPEDIQSVAHAQKLEDKGFGMLEDKYIPGKIDDSYSVVCPDGSVFNQEEIQDYLNKRGMNYCSENPEDVKIHNAQMYLLDFRG
jgi:hypothetical protein